ncbi:hypothetical protein [Alkalihalobacterium chitinilyticum]|uniref:Uncharacterized protein n=1 Tax=Alkalihalobacterium chitinilyticum TaxID=2980103 RepID=A0ABT5VJM7_9BACI|nr:hypothetical protein [Alkalihalobacterium chitinilyticum]MDE5415657.1 hypothetical protein [Alkalihalobacterium chitinilyticum]
MFKKIVAFVLLFIALTTVVSAQNQKPVEIFHIEKGEVIQSVPSTDKIQAETKALIESTTGLSKKFNPIPDEGYMIKVPFERAATIENEWFHDLVDQVVFIFPKDDKPHYLLFNDENTPFFFNFDGNPDHLLKELNFDPASVT